MKQPFAVFDIDGTVFRWQFFHELIFALVKAGELPFEIEKQVAEPRRRWQNRATPDAFQEYEAALFSTLQEGLKGVSVAVTKKLAKKIMEESGDKVYRHTRDLAASLKKEGYFLIAISGSFHEIVELFGKKYSFDEAIGVKNVHRNGIFTGEIIHTYNRKGVLLQEIVKKHNLTWEGSVGVGDSTTDISMLELVEKPLAFNPNAKLLDHAKKHGWDIAIERKNIVYKLQPKNGEYCLV